MMNLMASTNSRRMRTICPVCEGGPEKEKSLSLYRAPDYLSWTCYRATCEVGKGYSYLPVPDRTHNPQQPVAAIRKQPEFAQFTGELVPITKSMAMEVFLRWEIPPTECFKEGFKTAPLQDRLYMPVLLADGEEVGSVLRCLRKPVRKPKTINYVVPSMPLLHFPALTRRTLKDTVVLVEDIISATKASLCGVPVVALLGAQLLEREAMYLRTLGITTIILALDQDTWFKNMSSSLNIKKSWGLYFNDIELKYLTKDLKDTPIKEIKTIFSGIAHVE